MLARESHVHSPYAVHPQLHSSSDQHAFPPFAECKLETQPTRAHGRASTVARPRLRIRDKSQIYPTTTINLVETILCIHTQFTHPIVNHGASHPWTRRTRPQLRPPDPGPCLWPVYSVVVLTPCPVDANRSPSFPAPPWTRTCSIIPTDPTLAGSLARSHLGPVLVWRDSSPQDCIKSLPQQCPCLYYRARHIPHTRPCVWSLSCCWLCDFCILSFLSSCSLVHDFLNTTRTRRLTLIPKRGLYHPAYHRSLLASRAIGRLYLDLASCHYSEGTTSRRPLLLH